MTKVSPRIFDSIPPHDTMMCMGILGWSFNGERDFKYNGVLLIPNEMFD
ncbi:hypothetical protein AALA44_03380 [Enterococcus ratti]